MKKTRLSITYLWIALGVVFLLGVWAIVALILKSQGNMVILYPHESFVRVFELLGTGQKGRNFFRAQAFNIDQIFTVPVHLSKLFKTKV